MLSYLVSLFDTKIMSEVNHLVGTLKKQLKAQGMTYRDVAHALGISEPSVKRLFASGNLSANRLVEMCNLLGFTLSELAQEAVVAERRLHTLRESQERELVTDPTLLLVAVCALNQWTFAEIVQTYALSEQECLQKLLHLDRLRLIDVLPLNRIRLRVARDFDWLPNGPIRHYFRERGQDEFLGSGFSRPEESFMFTHGMLTESAIASLQDDLRALRRKFAELHAEALSVPLNKRRGVGLLFAMREWEPEGFTKLRRRP